MILKVLLNILKVFVVFMKILKKTIVFGDIFAGYLSNEKRQPIVTQLLIRGRKLNISIVFITQSYLAKNFRRNSTHYFIIKIPNKQKLLKISINYSSKTF